MTDDNTAKQLSASECRLTGYMPAGLFYFAAFPSGVPVVDSARSRQVWMLQKGTAFASLEPVERRAVVQSLQNTIERSEYHYYRFRELRQALEERRRSVPGEVFWDGLVSFVHFELQAYCGAVRLMVDEILYIAARRTGVTMQEATRPPWDATKLISGASCPVDPAGVPELRRLREHKEWYKTLNTYRNAFFHHGWRHGHGHVLDRERRSTEYSPGADALLVPDRASITPRSKPFQWTWREGTTIDEVVHAVRRDLDVLLEELLAIDWATPVPHTGSIPIDEQANLMVALVKPILLMSESGPILPVFSTDELGRSCLPFSSQTDLELVRVPVSTTVIGVAAFTFTLFGLETTPGVEGLSKILIVVDPLPYDAAWTRCDARIRCEVVVADILTQGTINPLSIPLAEPIEAVYVWRRACAEGQSDEWDG